MNFDLTQEQKLLIKTVREFVQKELLPLENIVEQNGFLDSKDSIRIRKLSQKLGLYAANIPSEYGGGGLSIFEWMLLEEQFGHTTDILIRRAFGNVYEILLRGTHEQIEQWLIPAVRGERTFSIAFTEPEAGSDAAGISSTAKKNKDQWLLNGKKHYISDGAYSDFFVVTAITDPKAGPKGISTFIIDKDTAGLSVGRDQQMMGLRGTSHVELFFENVILTKKNLLGEEGQGLKLALETLGTIRLAQVGARAVGKATRILNLTIEHATNRKQFKQPIANFQMIQSMLTDSAIEINSARLALWQTAVGLDKGQKSKANISMVKIQASEILNRVADRAVQIFGGMGYSKEMPIEKYFRDARIYRIYDGTSEIHRTIVAKALSKGASHLYDGGFS